MVSQHLAWAYVNLNLIKQLLNHILIAFWHLSKFKHLILRNFSSTLLYLNRPLSIYVLVLKNNGSLSRLLCYTPKPRHGTFVLKPTKDISLIIGLIASAQRVKFNLITSTWPTSNQWERESDSRSVTQLYNNNVCTLSSLIL